MKWQRKVERTRNSLTSSDTVSPGADFSATHFAWQGHIRFSSDWLGLKPMRQEAAASPLPLVSEAGRRRSMFAYSEVIE